MIMRKFVFALFLLPVCLAAQQASTDNVFTITVAAPTSSKDIQVRYLLNGNPSVLQSSSSAKPDDNQILIKTDVEGKAAKSFRAIVFSPGCQFATINADDLSTSNRQAQFQCQKLTDTSLHGKIDASQFSGRDLQVEALYVCGWAGQFFGVRGLSISPFSAGKAKVDKDGAFAIDLPDFSTDPLWSNLSHNATLMFFVVDAANGQQLAALEPPHNLARGGSLKVASSYPPEVQFTVQNQR